MNINQYAVIFDFDGLMANTEPIYWNAMQKMAKDRGEQVTLELKRKVMGAGGLLSMRIMKEFLGLSSSPEELLEEREKNYGELLHKNGAQPMYGLFDVIDLINKLNLKKTIASSSRLEWIEFILKE